MPLVPHPHRARCLVCGKHRDDVGPISWAGNCRGCGVKRLEENLDAMHSRSGAAFLAYRRAMVAAFGGVLLDDVPRDAHTLRDAPRAPTP